MNRLTNHVRYRRRRAVVRALTAATLAGARVTLRASPAAAHGQVQGTGHFLQDYGGPLFLLAIVLIGAAVTAWASLAPAGAEDEDEAPDPGGL